MMPNVTCFSQTTHYLSRSTVRVRSSCEAGGGGQIQFSSYGGDIGSKNRRQGYGGAYCVSAFGESLKLNGWFCTAAIGRNQVSIALKIFSHLIYFIKKFYKFCTFNAICKDNMQ
jgi:hypothetical protein